MFPEITEKMLLDFDICDDGLNWYKTIKTTYLPDIIDQCPKNHWAYWLFKKLLTKNEMFVWRQNRTGSWIDSFVYALEIIEKRKN